MTIEGYGYHIGLRAPIAYIRDEEGVCPVLVADLESLHNESEARAANASPAESPAPNRLERNTTDATEPSTGTAAGDGSDGLPQAEPPQGRVLPGELPPPPPVRRTVREGDRRRWPGFGDLFRGGRRGGGRGHQAVPHAGVGVMSDEVTA